MRSLIVFVIVLIALGAGLWFWSGATHLGTPPDPNDPRQAGVLTPDVLRANLKGVSDSLMARVENGEIDDARFRELISKAANTLLSQVDIGRIPRHKAWEYGEVYITARRWQEAKQALEIAVKVAKDEDRRVNDSLRLARVLAELNRVPEAIRLARTVFDTPDEGAAPILPATLLELVPAAEGKGSDLELARLLEDAITCHMRTIVDPNTKPGRDFLAARPYHVRKGWEKTVALYRAAGREDLAASALAKADAMTLNQQRT